MASFQAEGTYDIYITGSNARLLNSELATYLTGRYVEIPVYTLSFVEFQSFMAHYHPADRADSFRDYLQWGGFPGLIPLPRKVEILRPTLSGFVDSLVLRDVIQRHRIRDADSLLRILRFALDNVGNYFSARSVAAFFKNQGVGVSVDTVQTYLGYFTQAYVLHPAGRYDLKGKRFLEHQEKYYAGDIGLKTGLIGWRPEDIAGHLENLVYLELRRRGWAVSVGVTDVFEVDFVAQRGSQTEYFQVSYLLDSEATRQREFGNLARIQDNYPKTVLTLDPVISDGIGGIRHRDIREWLTSQET